MIRRILIALAALLCTSVMFAQDFSNIQIHGFVTQGLLYSTNNNFFTMTTSNGSARWTDGAISVSDSVSDKLRIGIQIHAYQLGDLGSQNLQIDWAVGDYRVNDKARFSFGKVKTVYGLFNDYQDVDTVHLWALLPEGFYPNDNKSFVLSHYGADFYGTIPLGKKSGNLTYRGFAGYRPLDLNGGYATGIAASLHSNFTSGGSNIVGGDLRWETPLKGLLVGISAITTGLNGTAPSGTFHIPYGTTPVYYAKFERGKFMAASEYKRNTDEFNLNINLPGGGTAFVPSSFDIRTWYVMSSYQILKKVKVGGYYSHYTNGVDQSIPKNYSKDWTFSGRYDISQNFYFKLEDHIINGTGLGYYAATNPAGEKTKTNLFATRVGFTF